MGKGSKIDSKLSGPIPERIQFLKEKLPREGSERITLGHGPPPAPAPADQTRVENIPKPPRDP